jgi:hypothetical protein
MLLCEIEFMQNGKCSMEIHATSKCVYHSMELESEIGCSQESFDLADLCVVCCLIQMLCKDDTVV